MLVRIGAVMGYGLEGGASLMEDYSYNFEPGNELDMGSHMLEVSPAIGTIDKPKLAIYPLGIGGKSDPVRLVFSGKPTDAVVVSMADERERFRLLMDEVTVVEPQGSLKNLPCARAVWKPKPDLKTAVQCWITAGGSHHTCMTTSVGREAWEDFARIPAVLFLFTYVRLSACRRTAAGRSRRRTRGSLPDAPPSATASGTCSPA